MKRTLSSFIIGLPITLLLFIFMSILANAKAEVISSPASDTPSIDRIRFEESIIPIVRPPLPEQEPVIQKPANAERPNEPKETIIQTIDPRTEFTISTTSKEVDYQKDFVTNQNQGASNKRNQEAVPLLISEARWPRNATTGGSVRLCFTVMPDGRAANVVVVNSTPGRMFVKTAKRAVYQWKFNPSYDNGIAIEQSDMCYTMDFNLED